MGKAKAYRELKQCVCGQCELEFEAYHKRKFCSKTCSERSRSATGRSREDIHAELRESRRRTCGNCGNEYIKKKGANHSDGELYCSRECGFAGSKVYWGDYCRIVEPKYTPIKLKQCVVCDTKHYGKMSTKAICSSDCRVLYAEINRVESIKAERSNNSCPDCGVPFCPTIGNKHRLCIDCADVKARRSKAISRSHRSRAKQFGCKYERFDPLHVLERDGWQCQACGCDTPREMRGTTDDNAPELDHVTPLSKGGDHTPANTQCLCRVCNILKSDLSMNDFINRNKGIGRSFSLST